MAPMTDTLIQPRNPHLPGLDQAMMKRIMISQREHCLG